MRNDAHRHRNGKGGAGNGFFSARSLANYVRIMSSGASNVASTVRSAGASIVSSMSDCHEDAGRDQVQWAGFDKLEYEGCFRLVLLLGYRSGFQVWDVDQAEDVRQIASRHDGPVSFLQMQKKLYPSKKSQDNFAGVRPFLIVVGVGSATLDGNNHEGFGSSFDGSATDQDTRSDSLLPFCIRFYSLRTHEYAHVLKFRASIISVRCSSQLIVVSQATQITCFDAATLARCYTILTYPIGAAYPDSSGLGYGPLSIGTRWLAYSGKLLAASNTGRVSPKHLSSAKSVSVSHPNSGLVANFAKESSKQLAVGLVTLGDIGYRKLSKYYSDFLTDDSGSARHGNSSLKLNDTMNEQLSDTEYVGMVIVRDILSKSVIVQFRAHSCPISALCFDPSGMLLVTASVHGHNINIFGIMPSPNPGSTESDAKGSYIHLYRLQRGITNAIIQDISFSYDSKWIMISSSRGTSHLFSLSSFEAATKPHSGEVQFANNFYGSETVHAEETSSYDSSSPNHMHVGLLSSGTPVTLSSVTRIRNGNQGLKGAVTGAAAAATGKVSPLSGVIASVFHNFKDSRLHTDFSSVMSTYYLLIFSPAGSIIQYVLRERNGDHYGINVSGIGNNSSYQSTKEADSRFNIEALQKWDVCHKRNRRDKCDNVDIYRDHLNNQSTTKHLQKVNKKGTVQPAGTSVDMRTNLGVEENQHAYLSEVELHTHDAQTPLWAKSQICFQVMMNENIKAYDSSTYHGEIDIENITSRTIEARSKGLVPVFDYHTSRLQKPRINASVGNKTNPLVQQKSGQSDNGSHSRTISYSTLDHGYGSPPVAESPNGSSHNGLNQSIAETEGFVNNFDDQDNLTEHLHDSESPMLEAQLEHIDN
ncbi:autophagy-related protein 18f-like isoform X1 [Curcuma longa]|uniref:autophagy-related protein 18f-like isoform X1 n=1 Tax=Curcuma longa TaxID=136217 RepID=UPI003D9DEBC3